MRLIAAAAIASSRGSAVIWSFANDQAVVEHSWLPNDDIRGIAEAEIEFRRGVLETGSVATAHAMFDKPCVLNSVMLRLADAASD